MALFQAVRELLFNVHKHAGVSSASVSVTLSPEGEIRIMVSDKGKGFDPGLNREGTEAGFGLFSIRERLQLLGGRLKIKSTPGGGSRFTLFAPYRTEKRDAAFPGKPHVRAHNPALSSGETPSENDRSKIRLLLVDDHQTMRSGLAALLGQEPDLVVVGIGSDGIEGIEMAAKLQPDLVLMDLSMPRMDGIEATRRITASWPAIKVIGLTMHMDAVHHDAMRNAGAVNCLVKSGPSSDLLEAIFETMAIKGEPVCSARA